MKRINSCLLLAAALAWPATAPDGSLATVISKPVSRTIELPGELLPFLSVSLHAKVPGYVEQVLVDRGSAVKQGELLLELSAPEMKAQIAEAESKVQARVRQAASRSAARRGREHRGPPQEGRRNAGRRGRQ
jgi:membrane fusion protein (multidrug efflux system)